MPYNLIPTWVNSSSPINLASIYAWHDPGQETTYSTGDDVTNFLDFSGNSRTSSYGGGNPKVKWTTNQFGSLPGFVTQTYARYDCNWSLGNTWTIAGVCKLTSTAGETLFGSDAGYKYVMQIDGTNIYNSLASSEYVYAAHGVTISDPHIYSIRVNGTLLQFFVDGVQVGVDKTVSDVSTTITRLLCDGANGYPADGSIGDMIACSDHLSDPDLATTHQYLKDKYGIA